MGDLAARLLDVEAEMAGLRRSLGRAARTAVRLWCRQPGSFVAV